MIYTDLFSLSEFQIEKHTGYRPNIGNHFHSAVEFFFLCNGKASYLIDTKSIIIEKGDLLIIPTNTIHNSNAINNNKRERILFYLSEHYINNVLGKNTFDLTKPLFFHFEDKSKIEKTIYKILDEYNGLNNNILINSLLCEFLIYLSRENSISTLLMEQKILSSPMSNILSYIKENYNKQITLSSVANEFHFNPSYLSRAFKENTGISFTKYVNKYRVVNAIKMLSENNKSITDIALLNGFSSLNNFCKVFKSNVGVSPLAYKKRNH